LIQLNIMVNGARKLRQTGHDAKATAGIGAADLSSLRLLRFSNAKPVMKEHDCTDLPMPGAPDSGSRDDARSGHILSMTENVHQHLH
jgi:hypothetical protein